MTSETSISPWRVLLPVGLGTGLSLIGDTSLYAVLPTHAAEAGVAVAGIGILLSANRFIRLALNGPVGWLYDRLPRRYLFVPALFIGALSTALYALTVGFWPLLLGRLLWGLAWAGIWVGGNTIIMDISQTHNRGRWIGIYQISFFLGASGGAMLGGLLTDVLGYHWAMGFGAGLTLLGAVIALVFLPETRNLRVSPVMSAPGASSTTEISPPRQSEFASAIGLMGVNRLALAGFFLPTFGLFLLERVGDSIHLAGLTVGVATLTGLGLGANSLISMLATPIMGSLSDRTSSRWAVAAGGLMPGIAGFGLLSLGAPLAFVFGVPLTAIASGSNQSVSTALVGDLSTEQRRGRHLGVLFTVGDLASAVGPPLAYAIIPVIGLSRVYLLSAAIFGLMFLVALMWTIKLRTVVAAGGVIHGIDQ